MSSSTGRMRVMIDDISTGRMRVMIDRGSIGPINDWSHIAKR